MLQHRKSPTIPTEPIDEVEQTKIIEALKLEAIEQTKTWRSYFSGLFIIIANIFAFLAVYSYKQPYELEHQRHFKNLVDIPYFIIYYAASSFVFFVAAWVVKDPTKPYALLVARIVALVVALAILMTWLKVFHLHGVTNPVLYWIPLADLAGLLLAQYIDLDSSGLVSSAESLDQYKYSFKSA